MSAIPQRESDLDLYSNNWRTLLTAAPATYGLLAADALAITNAYNTWHAAFLLTSNPATRTTTNVTAKDAAKAAMLVTLRAQYRIIKANPTVLDANKVALGIVINDPVPTPIPAPTTYPLISARNTASLEHTVEYSDSDTPTLRRKPTGVTGMLLFRGIGVAAALDPTQLSFLLFDGRTPVAPSTFSAGDVGKVASYAARWTNAKGDLGPWSPIVTKTISN